MLEEKIRYCFPLPVDPTPRRQPRPGEGRRLPLAQIGDDVVFILGRGQQVLEVLAHVVEGEVAGDVALHAGLDGGVDDAELLPDLEGGQDRDDGVLALKRGHEGGFRVGVGESVDG